MNPLLKLKIKGKLVLGIGVALVAASTGVTAAAAQDATGELTFPRVSGEVLFEIQNDWTYDSDDATTELNDLFTTTEPYVALHLTQALSLHTLLVLEPAKPPGPRDDRIFEDHGAFVEELVLSYETDRFRLYGGKFTPNFGVAWDAAPGVYGTDFAEAGYEFTERIGIGGGVSFGNESAGSHTLSASTFFRDTSALSESVITNRGRVKRSTGGMSNTEDFSSFAVSLDGGDISAMPDFGYHLAYIQQAAGDADPPGTTDEDGFAAAVWHTITLSETVEVSPLVEFIHFEDADGTAAQEREFLTASLALGWQSWNAAFSYTSRQTNPATGGDIDDHLFQVSAGYEFDFGPSLDVGWRLSEEGGVNTAILGALLAYTLEF